MQPFPTLTTRTPATLSDLTITLYLNANSKPAARFSILITFDNGAEERRTGDLWPLLTAQQQTAITTLLTTLTQRATAEMIPNRESTPRLH